MVDFSNRQLVSGSAVLAGLGQVGVKSLARHKAKILSHNSDIHQIERNNTFLFLDSAKLDVWTLCSKDKLINQSGGSEISVLSVANGGKGPSMTMFDFSLYTDCK